MSLTIIKTDSNFTDWSSLLSLLHEAFKYMDGRIDPPSSLHRLTANTISLKAQNESLFLAKDSEELVGCVFAASQPGSLYVGKLAVHPDHQRKGIGRCLMGVVERYAISQGVKALELNTRVELTENHSTFKSMGYLVTGEHSHEGYGRPTFISMRKELAK